MPRDWNRERVIVGRHENGESCASIARDFGLTRERIRQIVARNKAPRNVPAKESNRARTA